MANFLSTARTALLAAVKADTDITDLVRTWWEFNKPLAERFEVQPAECTGCALHPGRIVEPDDRYNAAYDLRQEIIILITTDGQVPDPCEELIALTLARMRACRDGMLGLASDGLKNIRATAGLEPWQTPGAARLMWQATITVTLDWILFA